MNRETVRQNVKEDLEMRKISNKKGDSNLDTWPETTSTSHFILSFTQCGDVWYGHYRRWNVMSSIRPRNKTKDHAVESTEFTSAEKSTHVSIAGQDHACVFLRSQGDSSLWIHCPRTHGKSTVLSGNGDKVTGICSEEKTRTMACKWILHNRNDPAHDGLRVLEFLAKNSITKMDHPPYSHDLAPCDFWLFPKLKNTLEGQMFADLPDIQRNVKTLLRGIPENDIQGCFRQWYHHLTKCITSQRVFRRRQQPLVHR